MVALRVVVLVEGHSDRVAVQTLARRLGRDLAAEGAEIVPMDGVTNIRAFAARYGPPGLDLPMRGLYDAPQEGYVRRGLAAAGLDVALEPDGLTALGFFGCSADLEDELMRALGTDAVEEVIEAAGEGRSRRLLAGMPAQRDWTREEVLRRFVGSQSGRKARYAELLVDALPVADVPLPLLSVLARV
ncbi:TOPRIM nucleotidyl transferase/hydrolase domain-containing protein [Nocardioides mangrovi]|uniref:OLD protein-like TOPRIM domain-containing protein n=1 Tax=Nocardioides mangrovi TaxID=2874580 RepID=A0ABS7UGA3_9ACTN|nr:TOPRIM nucleotidyl transferase/hydrolase domain-containing protein [Nocardioides mangrovi]MBZ5739662.1 hypothetical protein [Nocardioides mangrovi]